jgi:hypothetical protein
MNLTPREAALTHGKRFGRRPAIITLLLLSIAAFVAVATVVEAIRQGSWGPIWSVGWLPAVLLAWLWAPASEKPCRPRLRRPARR